MSYNWLKYFRTVQFSDRTVQYSLSIYLTSSNFLHGGHWMKHIFTLHNFLLYYTSIDFSLLYR
jgi:hypothetical protein